MACYGPLTAYQPKKETGGSTRLVFRKDKSETGIPITVPCGRCIGCKLERARQWAVRCMHEKRLHSRSAFITLTYDDAHLPPGGTLVLEHLQKFMRDLRYRKGKGVRYFACGEYGDRSNRPHYHVLLLSHDFADRKKYSVSKGNTLYTSAECKELWPRGQNFIGEVTTQSAAYVARYCTKKITGPEAVDHYAGRQPEFVVMSRRPGIGAGYFDKYHNEILDHDNIIFEGKPQAVPRYYDARIKQILDSQPVQEGKLLSRSELRSAKRRRKITFTQRQDNGSRRRRVKEVVTLARLKLKDRPL